MSGREFFVRRYEQMGWEARDVKPKHSIRINTANAEKGDVVERLETKGMELAKVPFLRDAYWVARSKFSAGATTEYLLGLYSIQEAAAQIPATLFSELKDTVVLDACAAPGGKTGQLADLMHGSGLIVALDVRRQRLRALTNQLERCRVKNTVVYEMDARRVSQLGLQFDRILLDVPCSGNYAADGEWFRRRTLRDVERNASVQRQILTEASKTLTDRGEMIYSTCSLEPEEDELNVDWAVRTLDLKVEPVDCFGEKAPTTVLGRELDSTVGECRRIWPGLTQGFFVCKLRKRA